MTTQISHGASGAISRFAGWVAGASVGYPFFDGGRPQGRADDEGDRTVAARTKRDGDWFAVFVNSRELDTTGAPTNEKYADDEPPHSCTSTSRASSPNGEPEISEEGAVFVVASRKLPVWLSRWRLRQSRDRGLRSA